MLPQCNIFTLCGSEECHFIMVEPKDNIFNKVDTKVQSFVTFVSCGLRMTS